MSKSKVLQKEAASTKAVAKMASFSRNVRQCLLCGANHDNKIEDRWGECTDIMVCESCQESVNAKAEQVIKDLFPQIDQAPKFDKDLYDEDTLIQMEAHYNAFVDKDKEIEALAELYRMHPERDPLEICKAWLNGRRKSIERLFKGRDTEFRNNIEDIGESFQLSRFNNLHPFSVRRSQIESDAIKACCLNDTRNSVIENPYGDEWGSDEAKIWGREFARVRYEAVDTNEMLRLTDEEENEVFQKAIDEIKNFYVHGTPIINPYLPIGNKHQVSARTWKKAMAFSGHMAPDAVIGSESGFNKLGHRVLSCDGIWNVWPSQKSYMEWQTQHKSSGM